jgi:hypothetical protein
MKADIMTEKDLLPQLCEAYDEHVLAGRHGWAKDLLERIIRIEYGL